MDRLCKSCGSPIPDDGTFCPECGTPAGPLNPRRRRWAWIAALTAIVLVASAAGAYALFSGGGGDSILYQDADSIGPDPFMSASAFATAEPQSDLPGKTPGLYGGSGELGVCDAEAIITFLMQNTDKRVAWAGVLGVPEDMIVEYIRSLRAVTLAQDTRTTNHGFKNGKAYGFQAILAKGTAVLVDTDGKIVVKCYCGNPQLPPVATDGPCIGCPPGYTPAPPCEGEECLETETPPPDCGAGGPCEETPAPTPDCVQGPAGCIDDPTPPPPHSPVPTTLKTPEPQPTAAPVAPASTPSPAPTPCDPNTAPNGCTSF